MTTPYAPDELFDAQRMLALAGADAWPVREPGSDDDRDDTEAITVGEFCVAMLAARKAS